MDMDSEILIHSMARNYLRCLADFPAELTPQRLVVPPEEQAALFSGLRRLYALIRASYQHFADLPIRVAASADLTPADWGEDEFCWKAIENPLKLLWAFGTVGQAADGLAGLELLANKAELDAALKLRGVKGAPAALTVLETLSLRIDFRGPDGQACPAGYKKCAGVALSAPGAGAGLLRALQYYAARFPITKNGLPFEVFLRADFRPLLPGYPMRLPHLPLEEAEITRTLDPQVQELWLAINHYPDQKYPQIRRFYRVPRLRQRGWITDFSTTGRDYGLWSIFSDEKGLRLRVVLKPKGYHYLLDHLDELSPRYQEIFLTRVACTDCTHCGKHLFYTHGDHVHRICKGPWYYSPYFQAEDLPDIERLIDIHLGHLK